MSYMDNKDKQLFVLDFHQHTVIPNPVSPKLPQLSLKDCAQRSGVLSYTLFKVSSNPL